MGTGAELIKKADAHEYVSFTFGVVLVGESFIIVRSTFIQLTRNGVCSHPINAVKLLTENILATGDDGGTIKLWDVRTGSEAMEYSDHTDFISDFDYDPNSKTLVASSGQGTISIYDIRKPTMLTMSENQDDELLSICIVKDRRKVVVGSQEGVLNIYSWGDWGDCTDRFLGHPNSIDTICKIDEDTIATGSSDGIIR